MVQFKPLLRREDICQTDRRHKGRGKRGDKRAEAVLPLSEQICRRYPQRDRGKGLIAPREIPPDGLEAVFIGDSEPG